MNPLKRIYYWFRLLSLDVALGAVIMTNSISFVNGVVMPVSISVALFLAVWLIYTLDHWTDARKLKKQASMPRHRFHQRYQKPLIALMLIQLLLGVVNMLFLPVETLYFGLVVGITVGVYFVFSILFRIVLIKEILIASIYTTGIFVGPVSLGDLSLTETFISLIIVFGLAFTNLIILAMYEMPFDLKDGSYSWPIRFGYKSSYYMLSYVVYGLLVLIALSALYLASELWLLYFSFFAMTVILYLVFNKPKWFRQKERYRIYADLIFFIPACVFFL